MDDDEEIARLLAEYGLELPGMEGDVPDDETAPRLSDLDDDLGGLAP